MQKSVYEYAVIRIVPRVEREEFMNIGVIVFCKSPVFIGMKYEINAERLKQLDPDIDIECIRDNMAAFEKIAHGLSGAGPLGKEDAASRFRWLTAQRSSIIQTSRPHVGMSSNPAESLEKIFQKMVRLPES